jgi:hypothetical protein
MRTVLSCAAIVLVSPTLAWAERQPPRMVTGAKVQVFAGKGVLGYTADSDPRRSMHGTIESISSEHLTVRDGQTSQQVRFRDISRLKIVNGKRRNVLGGAIVGALIAAVAVPVLVVATWDKECACESGGSSALPYLGLIGAGAAVGGGVGALVMTDRWERMPVPVPAVSSIGDGRVRLSVRGARRGATVGLTLGF